MILAIKTLLVNKTKIIIRLFNQLVVINFKNYSWNYLLLKKRKSYQSWKVNRKNLLKRKKSQISCMSWSTIPKTCRAYRLICSNCDVNLTKGELINKCHFVWVNFRPVYIWDIKSLHFILNCLIWLSQIVVVLFKYVF